MRFTSFAFVGAALILLGEGCTVPPTMMPTSTSTLSPAASTTTSPVTRTPSLPPVRGDLGCKIGGCSSQLCGEASEGPLVSTCEFKPEYACFKYLKTCKRQPSGICHWEPGELTAQQRCVETKEYENPISY